MSAASTSSQSQQRHVAPVCSRSSATSRLQLDHLCGGLCGGLLSTLIVHPIDMLKIRFAVDEGGRGRSATGSSSAAVRRPHYTGYMHALGTIVRHGGLAALYRGAAPNIIGATTSWGLYFQFYNGIKCCLRSCRQLPVDSPLGALDHSAASMAAGGCTLTLTNPIFVCKTRMCLQYETALVRHGASATLRQTMRQLWTEGGVRALYKGYLAGLVGTSHGAVQFVLYEEFRARYCRRRQLPFDAKLDTSAYLVCACASKTIAVAATYPYQVVRSRLQDQHAAYSSSWQVVRRTWAHERIAGFYKGMAASIVRVAPATAVTFAVYEHVALWVRHALAE